eukprot:CAMPEP_0178664608 /NCGR_PEP_ID=MMETSP0698-20121128/29483_1 /TAXON_ID=265572 /ORGANISM="Extubocellulus spinifer, Strain CCMP396" /LENGTH=80 /DNA_ID=CAMNT_0020307811 /DNA_START=463 /DNA_END=705 /DNA_ORIENTATION=+
MNNAPSLASWNNSAKKTKSVFRNRTAFSATQYEHIHISVELACSKHAELLGWDSNERVMSHEAKSRECSPPNTCRVASSM